MKILNLIIPETTKKEITRLKKYFNCKIIIDKHICNPDVWALNWIDNEGNKRWTIGV